MGSLEYCRNISIFQGEKTCEIYICINNKKIKHINSTEAQKDIQTVF